MSQNLNLFYFRTCEEKIWSSLQRIIELFKFLPKNCLQTLKSMVWDPGVKKAPEPGSGSATLSCMFKGSAYCIDWKIICCISIII